MSLRRNILLVMVGVCAHSFNMAPSWAESPSQMKHSSSPSNSAVTRLKLTLNEVDSDSRVDRADRPVRLSEAELLRLAELKGKFEDSTASKRAELESLQRQIRLALLKATVDRAYVLQLQSRINIVNSDLANARLNFMLDVNDGMPSAAKERMRKHLLLDAAFGPPEMGFGGPPPPGPGLPPTCVPPGFGAPPPPIGPPPMMGFPPGLRTEGIMGPKPGRGPEGSAEFPY
ncbi:MAG TPA: hypothetical protein V6C89_03965 [Drouetiella sp.]|jgi:hypothetical protein